MRQRSIFAVGLLTSLTGLAGSALLTGCEDGPSQTYMPSPANAGNLWNNGSPDAAIASGKQAYDAGFGSVNALQHCTADEKRLTWAKMMTQPIVPPYQFAGLNLAHDTNFAGLTLQEAEKINCTGNPIDDGDITWGNSGEVWFSYNPNNYRANSIVLSLGYTGKMTFHQQVGPKGADGKCAPASRFETFPTPDPDTTGCTGHTYEIELGQPLMKDGQEYNIDWDNYYNRYSVINELLNAMMATYGKDAIGYNPNGDYDDDSCTVNSSCADIVPPSSSGSNNGYCEFGVMPLGQLLFVFNCSTATEPTISTPIMLMDEYLLSEPYCYEDSVAQLSAQGPLATPRFNNAVDPAHCYMQLGMDWPTYTKYCVDLAGDAGLAIDPIIQDAGLQGDAHLTINQVNEAKAVAAPGFDLENWSFSIVGVETQWNDQTVEQDPQSIILDNNLPSKLDPHPALNVMFTVDGWNEGQPRNDMSGGTFTGQGTAYVYREFARLLQADLNSILAAAYPNRVTHVPVDAGAEGGAEGGADAGSITQSIYNHPIGDPACEVDPATAYALGCTGMETFAIAASPPTAANPSPTWGDPSDGCSGGNPSPICNAYTAGAYFAQYSNFNGYSASVFKGGMQFGVWCQDPNAVWANFAQPQYNNCTINTLWVGALSQVEMVAGQGNLNNLPAEIADMRYYFRWYGYALIKYLKAYGANPTVDAQGVAAQTFDIESVFYDSYNSSNGYQDDMEYIERTFMSPNPVTYTGAAKGSPSDLGAVTVPTFINEKPLDFMLNANLLGGIMSYQAYTKFLYRPEVAMFQAMLATKTDLPASENNVNITNIAGSQLLQQNYASYECATEWPKVTIKARQSTDKDIGPYDWDMVCAMSCPGFQNNNNFCPPPPLQLTSCGAAGDPCQPLQYDLNGQNMGGVGLGGKTPRLAHYPAVWGPGSACPDPLQPGEPSYQLDPTKGTNTPYGPYTTTAPCAAASNAGYASVAVPTAVGSVFTVGQRPAAAARLSYVGADKTHPLTGTNATNLTAWVNIPNMPGIVTGTNTEYWDNPYEAITLTGQPAPTNIQVTMPWVPQYDNVGFTVPLDGLRNKFYPTQELLFAGVLETYRMYVVPWQDPISRAYDGTLTIEAVEGDDFLGEAFICQDAPGSGDLLGAHMYDSAASILSWITAHPGSEIACNIVVRYSIYDNYIDYITGLNAGVTLDINQGGGYGRVVGATVFDPTLSFAP